ncbi:MAG: glycosyltransferase family 4 protein [Rhodopirellula sp.]|nr:glycosyltransferase family 4 protein [Rhodopirellula sp.]
MPLPVQIALVHDWLTGMRGGEKCLEVLCRRFPSARLFTLVHARGRMSADIERMRITTSFLQRFPGVARHYRYLLPLMPSAVERFELPGDVDVVLSFSHAVAKSIKPPPGVPHVCYCFTPMRYAWHRRDDYFVASGRISQAPINAARGLLLDWLQQWDLQTSRRVTHFVAVSRTVAARIADSYGRTSRVVYPPVDTEFYRPAEVGRDDYYLCVSALVPYKRIDLAIEACNRLGRRLVVIGAGPERARLGRLAGRTVELTGWLSDEQIRDHFRRCSALLFPGHEDFGIVPVEAQACGAPVIAFGQGGVTETVLSAAGDRRGTGLFFSRQTADSLCGAIEQFEANRQCCDSRLARRQAERFATERFERELIDYLQEVVSQASAPSRMS